MEKKDKINEGEALIRFASAVGCPGSVAVGVVESLVDDHEVQRLVESKKQKLLEKRYSVFLGRTTKCELYSVVVDFIKKYPNIVGYSGGHTPEWMKEL